MTPAARLAVGEERTKASQLLQEGHGVDLLQREQQSRARVNFIVWPDIGSIKTAAGLVVHRDNVGFLYVPVGERHPTALDSIYTLVREQAIVDGANVILFVTRGPQLQLAEEVVRYGYEYVGQVLRLQNKSPHSAIRMLARLCESPIRLPEGDAQDCRLANLIQATHIGSLSDPALLPNCTAADFLTRLRLEKCHHKDRFVYQVDGTDAAVCLLHRDDDSRMITVRYLGVAPNFRGRKLGGKLLATSLATVWSDSYELAEVGVDEQNTYALNIYVDLGFEVVTVSDEFALQLR